jgi:hypothetical protein
MWGEPQEQVDREAAQLEGRLMAGPMIAGGDGGAANGG